MPGDAQRAPRLVFERRGLGYVGSVPEVGVTLALDRIHQSGGETKGELTVVRTEAAGSEHLPPEERGHLLRASFNASSMSARSSTSKYLTARSNSVNWGDLLEAFCLNVLKEERRGEPFTSVGTAPPPPGLRYVLRPLLPLNRPTILFGQGGSGKSTLAAAAAVAVATGTPPVNGWVVEEQGQVLILDWEADGEEWNERVVAISRGLGIEPPSLIYRSCVGALTDQVEAVAKVVQEHGVRLLIIDSMGMATPSRREGTDVNEGALRMFGALRAIGTTSLLLDHVVKADVDDDKGATTPYGSVYKTNLARSSWELRCHRVEEDGALRHLMLVHRKVNRGRLLDPIGIAQVYGTEGEVLHRQEPLPSGEDAPEAAGMAYRIKTLLASGPASPTEVAETLGLKRGSVSMTLGRLADRGEVEKRGSKYVLIEG